MAYSVCRMLVAAVVVVMVAAGEGVGGWVVGG
jgi:Flp pilus assembly pilin Flp